MVTKFQKKIYQICKKIPRGRITTYKIVAEKMKTKAYRAIGTALNKNPYGILKCEGKNMVPCHRIINSNGFVGGFANGIKNKIKLLKKEGIKISNNKILNLDKILTKKIN